MDEAILREKMVACEVPPHLHNGLINYLIHRYPAGHFLTAVLSNDLVDAVRRGDNDSRAGLSRIVCFLDGFVDRGCWGSKQRVSEWLSGRAE